MAYLKNFTMGSLVLTDGTTPAALSHTCDMDLGTVQLSGVVPGLRETSDYERKGRYVSSAYTTRKYPSLSVTFQMATFTDTSAGTISDFILGTAGTPFAARVSTIAPSGATAGKVPLACDAAFAIEGTDFGEASDISLTVADWRIEEWGFSEGDPNEITLSGPVLGAIGGDLAVTEA
jgi:hypothetical protein